MKKKIQKYLRGEREGFSLVELIIVIAIMAILIGVIALVVLPYLKSARESRDRQALADVTSAFKSAMSNESVAQEVIDKPIATAPGDSARAISESDNPLLYAKINEYLEGESLADAESGLSAGDNHHFAFAVIDNNKYYVCIQNDKDKLQYDSDDLAFDTDKTPLKK